MEYDNSKFVVNETRLKNMIRDHVHKEVDKIHTEKYYSSERTPREKKVKFSKRIHVRVFLKDSSIYNETCDNI